MSIERMIERMADFLSWDLTKSPEGEERQIQKSQVRPKAQGQ